MSRGESMSDGLPGRSHRVSAGEQAAQWLARRDRGLKPAEQDDYLQWLQEDPRHATLIAGHEATLRRMMRLTDWQPALGSEPNPDLFAPWPRHRRLITSALAAAAMLAVGFFAWRSGAAWRQAERAQKSYLRVNERQVLPDGSVVELKDGTQLAVLFSPAERRVRLTGSEALFTVAKNPSRPFLVEAGKIAVRAVGTAFDVRLDSASVDILVTEGKVRLECPPEPNRRPAAAPSVAAGQRATVLLASSAPGPRVADLTPAEINEALAWQAPRLQFFDTPLIDAVAEFNRHNHQQIVIGDKALNSVRIGGTFRLDNVDGFARLLEITMGMRAERRSSGDIVLRRARLK
jgi:transmembrane sensor